MATLSFDDFIDSLDGLTDQQLRVLNHSVVDTLRGRRKAAGRKIAASLEVGSKVRISSETKPKYLAGQTGVVEAFRTERITVKLDRGPMGKFHTGKVICPPAMLTLIED